MVLLRSSALALVLAAGLVHVKGQGDITPLSPSEIAPFAPFTHFASTAYCNPSTTLNWTCGSNCQANADFQPVASGGDGSFTQYWYVGFSPSQNAVIVAHQGTNPQQLLAVLTDENVLFVPLDQDLFPGVPSSVQAHIGFTSVQARTASSILSSVSQTLLANGASKVAVVGHSLGAAISLLDAAFLRLNLDASVEVQMYGYGMPRVGNQAFANWIDSQLSGVVTHINNVHDPVPILPSMFLGFRHPEGEIHITDDSTDVGTWLSCSGQDNPSTKCIVGAVPGVIQGNVSNHDGPYDGIVMGCSSEGRVETPIEHVTGFLHQVLSHFRNLVLV